MKDNFISSQCLFHPELIHFISYIRVYIKCNSVCKTKVINKLLTSEILASVLKH